MNDAYLKNTIAFLKRNAITAAIKYETDKMSKKEKQVFEREKKLNRILNQEDKTFYVYNIIWEIYIPKEYWHMIYEQRRRERILF